ncbi:MAG TPA: hypothetical protein ENH99_01480 [Candidatus Pacearchaeota archaeon]|nr:hypothetical protein [Candidatus Pacearchaeota archaeon]
MQKFEKRICPTCKKPFIPKSERNIYCCRSHFKKAYYYRKKKEESGIGHFPVFNCPICEQKVILNFNPIKEIFRWEHFVCPGCNIIMINPSVSMSPSASVSASASLSPSVEFVVTGNQ